jgi:hypothetical protein
VTIHLTTDDLLLLAVVPFLLVIAVVMTVGLFNGPRHGGFRLLLPWGWLWVVLPTVLVGLYGIARAVVA